MGVLTADIIDLRPMIVALLVMLLNMRTILLGFTRRRIGNSAIGGWWLV